MAVAANASTMNAPRALDRAYAVGVHVSEKEAASSRRWLSSAGSMPRAYQRLHAACRPPAVMAAEAPPSVGR